MATDLTKKAVEHAKPAAAGTRYTLWDGLERGLGLRVTDKGAKTWMIVRRISGEWTRRTLGRWPDMSLADAREKAAEYRGQMAKGVDPKAVEDAQREAARRQREGTVEAVATTFIEEYAKENQRRSWEETDRILKVYVLPRWRDEQLTEIRRSDVAKLLSAIAKDNGPVMADRTLAAIRKLFNWAATKDDELVVPFVKGMAKTSPKKRARTRVLSDPEIRALWAATATTRPAAFGPLVRCLLLTAQRREEVAQMTRAEIEGDTWTIPAERYKTNIPNVVPLTAAARAIVEKQPTIGRAGFVFTTTGTAPVSGYSKAKRDLDAGMLAELRRGDPAAELPPWVLHDLRRTARSLMSRAGVRTDIGERVLGHVIAGVAGTYDRHDYLPEKADALEKLAALVERIISPPADNVVVPLRA